MVIRIREKSKEKYKIDSDPEDNMKKSIAFLILSLVIINSLASADVPATFSYQGILTDSLGEPVEDDIYAIQFRIYEDSATTSPLWESNGFIPKQTTDGLFNHIMGSSNPLPDSLSKYDGLWVGITVDLDDEMTPRTPMTSVPFALSSQYADTTDYALDAYHSVSAETASEAQMLGGLERSGFVEEGEPDAIDSNMIVDGSISSADIGFSGFHYVYNVYAVDSFSQSYSVWHDIDSLTLDVNIESDSMQFYVSMEIHDVELLTTKDYYFRIIIDNNEVAYSHYYRDEWAYGRIRIAIHLSQIVTLTQGIRNIRGQFKSTGTLYGRNRNLIGIGLK
jgi:hypothetical protein